MFKTALSVLFLTFIFGIFFNVTPADVSELESEELIKDLESFFDNFPEFIASHMKGAIIHVILTKEDVPVRKFTFNCKIPAITEGPPPNNLKVDVKFIIDDGALASFANETLDPVDACEERKIWINGDLDVVKRLFLGMRYIKYLTLKN